MDFHGLLACLLELLSCTVFLLNVIAFILSSVSDIKNYMFMSLLVLQLATASIFVVFIGPSAIAGCNLFPHEYYIAVDILGNSLWFMCALLKATIALERLLVFMHANASQFVNKLSTVMIILATEAVLAVMGWLFIYDDVRRWQIITASTATELSRFPEPLNFAGPSSPFAIIGLVIDAIVTVISIAAYTAIYIRMNQLNKSTCCLLSERQLYRRRQREFKLVVEFCISTALYLGLWFTIRVITPYIQRDGSKNRMVLTLLPLLQVFYVGSHATLYVVLFGTQKGKKGKPKTTVNVTTMVTPPKQPVYRNICAVFRRSEKIEPASPTIEIKCCQ